MEFQHGKDGISNTLQVAFNRLNCPQLEHTRAVLDVIKEDPKDWSAVIADLRTLILEPSLTFLQKADEYVDEQLSDEAEAEKFFRHIWDMVMEGKEPFPGDTKSGAR